MKIAFIQELSILQLNFKNKFYHEAFVEPNAMGQSHSREAKR